MKFFCIFSVCKNTNTSSKQGPDLRLVLTWGPTPSDLDSRVVFFNDNGDEVCKLYWNNKKCDDYATLDVDETNVS